MADGPLHKIGEGLLGNEEYVDTNLRYEALVEVYTDEHVSRRTVNGYLHKWTAPASPGRTSSCCGAWRAA
jgi:hypothetical protein